MKRSSLPCLVLPLLLAGCGGTRSTSSSGPVFSTLGEASVSLAIAGNAAPSAGKAFGRVMAGTGTTQGSVAIADTAPRGAGVLSVRAEVDGTASANGGRLGQLLILDLDHPAALAVGQTLAVGASSGYAEETLAAGEAYDGYEGPTRFWEASGGTATVTALSGKRVTLTLSGVALPVSQSNTTPLTISGTLSGTVEPSMDL